MIRCLFNMAALYLAFALLIVSIPDRAAAMYIPAGSFDTDRAAEAAPLRTLESVIIRQRLIDLGLTEEEAAARLNRLTDEQIHRYASNPDSIQAGAEAVDVLVIILFVSVVAIGALDLTGHRVIIR